MGLWDDVKDYGSQAFDIGTLGMFGGGGVSGITDKLGLTDTGATDRAMQAQKEAAEKAMDLQKGMYGESTERFAPWAAGGLQSFQDLMGMARDFEGFEHGDIESDPGYQFRMQEGAKALDRSAAARGRLGSGATMKALQGFGQDLASQEYEKAYGRHRQEFADKSNLLSQLAQYGHGANIALTGQGQAMASRVGETATQLGSAQAAGEMGRGNEMKQLWQMGIQGAGMMCWVARAVFGENDPKWLEARYYINYIGPKWFKELYRKYGPEFAKKVEKSKILRIVLRPLFEYFALIGRIEQGEAEVVWQ